MQALGHGAPVEMDCGRHPVGRAQKILEFEVYRAESLHMGL